MRALVLAAFLLPAPAGEPRPAADATTIKLVEHVLKTPTSDLDPTLARAFLKLDVGALPARLRTKARVKRLELNSLIAVSSGRKKGSIRFIGAEGCVPPKPTPADIPFMVSAGGFVEVQEWALAEASAQTECSEQDLQCEFTLHIVDMPKGRKPPRRYFFQERDPMLAIVQMKEKNIEGKQTHFFGAGFLKCQRPQQ